MPPNTFMAIQLGIGAPAVGAVGEVGGNATYVPVPGPPQPRKTRDQLRVVVAGESGQGKTTFLNNFFRYLNGGENPMDQAATVVQATGSGIFGNGKTLRIEEREFDYTTEGGQEYKFFLVDTPGYGDHVNASQSFHPVVDYIENGNKRYLAKVKNGNDTPEEDGRTDVCIYFIAAHRFKHIDIKYLKQLCKVVGVIPVIGKSDCMTVEEMKEFKTVIVDLAAQDDEIEFFQFLETSWEQCKLKLRTQGTRNTPDWLGERQPPPYAVISSKVDKSDGGIRRPVPVRSYAWGDCNVMETRNSDNAYLQRLLLEVGFQDIKDKMREHHRAFVMEKGRPRHVVERAGDYVKAHRMSTLALVMATLFVLFAVVLVDGNSPKPAEGPVGWSTEFENFRKLEEKGWDRMLAVVESDKHHRTILQSALVHFYVEKELPGRITDYYEAQENT